MAILDIQLTIGPENEDVCESCGREADVLRLVYVDGQEEPFSETYFCNVCLAKIDDPACLDIHPKG